MNLWNKFKGFFNRKERRQHDKEVKQEQRKWWQFWKRKPAEPEPEAKPEAGPEPGEKPFEPDQDFADILSSWEEKIKREQEEAEQKRADEEKKRQQYEQARDTANKRYGTEFTQEEYDKMWDTYGSSDLSQYFPSDVVIYAAEFAKQSNIPFSRFAEILKEVAQSAAGQGWNREEAAQQLWSALDREASKYNEERSESYYDDLY